MPRHNKAEDVTFAVTTADNYEALPLCLMSVLNAETVPGAIHVRFEGSLPRFARFYLEQIADYARFIGVQWDMTVSHSQGIRHARDYLLSACSTPVLWMGDDDVVFDFDCLRNACKALDVVARDGVGDVGYLCGVKVDCNNRRGYGDFDLRVRGEKEAVPNCSQNHHYDKQALLGKIVPTTRLDTGNSFYYPATLREHKLQFRDAGMPNCGAEDAIFALRVKKAKLRGIFIPAAAGIHLEKERIIFDSHANRAGLEHLAAKLHE